MRIKAVVIAVLVSYAVFFRMEISAAAETKNEVKLEPASLFHVRDGLPNLAAKLKAGGDVNVVFLGGSITVGGSSPKGYATCVRDWLAKNYPKARIHIFNAGISGTGSDFGAARYDRDVLVHNPDIVFIEFCVNDGDSDRTVPMERMVHKTWLKNPKTDMVIFYTLEKHHLPFYKDGKLPPSASSHERVAEFYGIPSFGTGYSAASKINSGEIKWEQFSPDGCHPNQQGYEIFDDVFMKALSECLKAEAPKAHQLGKSITPNLQVYPPKRPTRPAAYKGEFISAKGERAVKVYPLPVPAINWISEPVYNGPGEKPLWRLSWMPNNLEGKMDATVGADKSKWDANSMEWFEEWGFFCAKEGKSLFQGQAEKTCIGYSKEISVLRFIAPRAGRYAVSVKSGRWETWLNDDKEMSFSVLKFSWNGGPGETLAFLKEVKKDSKGLDIAVETRLLPGEELAFIPYGNVPFGTWTSLMIIVGYLGE